MALSYEMWHHQHHHDHHQLAFSSKQVQIWRQVKLKKLVFSFFPLFPSLFTSSEEEYNGEGTHGKENKAS